MDNKTVQTLKDNDGKDCEECNISDSKKEQEELVKKIKRVSRKLDLLVEKNKKKYKQ
jgi:Zn-finger protein